MPSMFTLKADALPFSSLTPQRSPLPDLLYTHMERDADGMLLNTVSSDSVSFENDRRLSVDVVNASLSAQATKQAAANVKDMMRKMILI